MFCNWRKRYAGLMPSEVKRLRQHEEDNGKLKRPVADLRLDKPCCRMFCLAGLLTWVLCRACCFTDDQICIQDVAYIANGLVLEDIHQEVQGCLAGRYRTVRNSGQ